MSLFAERQSRARTQVRYKLRWFDRLAKHAKNLLATGEAVVLAGDYNVMPTDLDVYAPERWVDDALFRPEVREAYRRLVEQGWTDALRALHPGERIYTFWKYFWNAFGRDVGLRIDSGAESEPRSHYRMSQIGTRFVDGADAVKPEPSRIVRDHATEQRQTTSSGFAFGPPQFSEYRLEDRRSTVE
jgi:exodeoxyribonuclease III